VAKREEADPQIWPLLDFSVRKLNDLSFRPYHLAIVYYYFLWNLLSFAGFRPELYYCVRCQKKLTSEDTYFISSEGGLICSECKSKAQFYMRLNSNTIKIVRMFLEKDLDTLKKTKN